MCQYSIFLYLLLFFSKCRILLFAIKSPFDPPPVVIRLDDVTGGEAVLSVLLL